MLMHARIMPKTNISKVYYKQLVDEIEHDPLIKPSTLSVVCFIAVICLLGGAIIWFAKFNPGNLIQTTAAVTSISSGKTDLYGTVSTFITFDFKTRDGSSKSVRQQVSDGLTYTLDQQINVGYHPKNPNYARNLNDNRPDRISILLWIVPLILASWLGFVALLRYHARQVEIWNAADAAEVDE